jgi:hypothetical protein
MIKRSTFFALGAALLIVGSLVGCSSNGITPKYDWVCGTPSSKADCSDTAAYKAAQDPRNGWVNVFKDLQAGGGSGLSSLMKRCDGTTLIYEADGYHENSISNQPNSPECTSKNK